MDPTYIALGAVILSAIGLAGQLLGKNLSIREHEVFKGGVETRLKEIADRLEKLAPNKRVKHMKEDLLRDLKRIEDRLILIEATRPSNSELKNTSDMLGKRLDDTQARIDATATSAALREANTATTLATTTAASVVAAATVAAAAANEASKKGELYR
jgi:hypothetical protein